MNSARRWFSTAEQWQRAKERRRAPVQHPEIAVEYVVEAAGVEISRDVNETERLLHDQELGVPAEPTVSAVIWWPRAERGQSTRAQDPSRRRVAQLSPGGGVLGEASMRPIAERGNIDFVTAAVKALLEQARRLTDEEREELAEALLAELDGDDAELEDGWDAEIARRDALVESGEMPLHDAESVMAEADALLRARTR